MESVSRATQVKRYVQKKLVLLQKGPHSGETKALLANLRRGIGRIPGDSPELWGMLLQDLPEEMQSKNGTPTREEWAVYIALTLFAMHQQGYDPETRCMSKEGESLGEAVRKLVPTGDDASMERIRRRFNALATSLDMQEAAYHLRGIIQLLRTAGIPLDYPALAADLYNYQFPEGAQRVRLLWGQSFYHVSEQTENVQTAQDAGKEDSNE